MGLSIYFSPPPRDTFLFQLAYISKMLLEEAWAYLISSEIISHHEVSFLEYDILAGEYEVSVKN